ncbi:23S rRNA (uracil(1939)-C(5))-methyltransferase RlmD [Candidatus Peregrinibacteria bacterium]|nr:23S rRNA (uracil(1939)-C(5))-methyltransferase RlmD [Candidatus Peregrinibacteria bacterium]
MRDPKCPYFGKCGGCAMQHVPYEVQLENKKKRLAQALSLTPDAPYGLKPDDIQVFSGDEWNYRNRMDMLYIPMGLGFREKGRWTQYVDVKECAISNPKLNALMKEVREVFNGFDSYDLQKGSGTFRYAVIRTPQNDSCISFVLNTNSSRVGEAIEKIKAFALKSSVNNVLVTYVPSGTDQSVGEDFIVIKGSDMLHESFLGKEFEYSAQGFFQNNHEMATQLHEYVRGLLESYGGADGKLKEAHLLDLYGGVGTFGIINADLFKSVTIVESFAGCIDAAKKNLVRNGLKNAEALVMDAKQLKNVPLKSPLYVVNDPPRGGMHPKTVDQLIKLEPEVIIYVSCNVLELEKDMKKLEKHFKLKSAALFDLFPQTNHSESVVELKKRGSNKN